MDPLIEKWNPKAKVTGLIQAVKSAEKKSFPTSEAFDFESELKKKNTTLLIAYRVSNSSSAPVSKPNLSSKPLKNTPSKPSASPPSSTSSLELLGYAVYIRTKSLTRLHKICVVDSQRRKGIGRALLSKCIEEVRRSGAEEMDLWVDVERIAARELYKAVGFEEMEQVKDYYGPGRDAWRMRLKL